MAVGNYAEISLPIRATATITQNRAINFAGAVPAAGANGAVAVFGGASGDMITVNVMGTAQAEAGLPLVTLPKSFLSPTDHARTKPQPGPCWHQPRQHYDCSGVSKL